MVCVCAKRNDVRRCDSFGWMRKQLGVKMSQSACVCVCVSRLVWNVSRGVQGSLGVHGECRSFSHSTPVPSIPRTLDKRVLPGCDEVGNPTRCIWISHTCPVASAEGCGRLNEAARGDGDEETARVSWGTAGRWCFISSSVFISQVVKFIYQLSILCFVSLLYLQYKVTINSIWESRDRLSSSSASYFPSSVPDALKFCDYLHKIQKQGWKSRSGADKESMM